MVTLSSSKVKSICQYVRDYAVRGVEAPFTPTDAGTAELALRLNQFYGIP